MTKAFLKYVKIKEEEEEEEKKKHTQQHADQDFSVSIFQKVILPPRSSQHLQETACCTLTLE